MMSIDDKPTIRKATCPFCHKLVQVTQAEYTGYEGWGWLMAHRYPESRSTCTGSGIWVKLT